MAQGPHELSFVLDVPPAATVSQAAFDVYRPEGGEGRLPAVILVPGPVPAALPLRPRRWPLYEGYGHLVAGRGVVAVVLDLPYHDPSQWLETAEELPGIVESVRELDGVDPGRVALWAFSGAGLLMGRWLEDSPPWLRCVALTYPMLVAPDDDGLPGATLRPGRPLVVTRAGRERPDWQAAVDCFLDSAETAGAAVQVVDVPNGQHGFDVLDHTDESRQAVLEATDLVVANLLS